MTCNPPQILCADLCQSQMNQSGESRFEPPLPSTKAVLRGQRHHYDLGRGLTLYYTDVEDLISGYSSNTLTYPGLKASFLLSGSSRLGYGRKSYDLYGNGPGVAISLTQDSTFHRYWQRGRQERKVGVTLHPEFIENMSEYESPLLSSLKQFNQVHLNSHRFQPSQHLLQLAQQLYLPANDSLIARLERERIALEIVGLLCAGLSPAKPLHHNRHWQRMSQLRDLLESGEADGLSMLELASRVGTNAVDMQKHFRQQFGSSVYAYLRITRLKTARRALENGASVEQACAKAGYESLSSFSSAFQRTFGERPSRLKQRR